MFATGSITSSGTGLRVANSNGGTINFNSPTIALTTGANKAVTLDVNNAGGTINFNPAGGTGLDISTTTGTGFSALGGGTITVQGSGNSIIAGVGGIALDMLNVTVGAAGVNFGTTTSGGGLRNVKLTGVTGGAVALGTGSLTGATGAAFLVGNGAGGANTGGTAAITYGGTITTTGTARAVDIQDRAAGAGNITLSETITHSSGNANVIFLDGNAAGTIAFSGANSVLNGGTSTAVSLTNNTGATINFTGGGLDIDTTTGTGLLLTGGGTMNVTGTGNTIVTTTGTALNVTNTNIGASHLTFQSISAGTALGSAGTGIILNATGSSGGLHVTGTGAAASGGTIRNKTGANGTTNGIGIYLSNTSGVQLAWMQLNDFQNNAIRGLSVTGFRLTNSVINGANGNNSTGSDGAISFGTSNPGGANGLFGTGASASLIDNVNVSGAIEHTIEVYNQSGSFGLTISNSSIHDNTVASGSDGILIEMQGTASATVNITTNQFSNLKSQGIQVAANDNSAVNLTISGNIVTRGTQGNEGIVLSNGSNADLTTLVSNNTISGFGGVAIFVGQTAGNASASSLLDATISGNTITTPTTATNHAMIAFLTSTTGQVSQARLLIDGNTITQNATTGVARAILVDAPDTGRTPEYHATVINNNVDVTDGSAAATLPIAVQARNGATGHFDVRNNDVDYPNGNTAGINGVRVREDATSTAELARGVSASNDPAVVLAANNPNGGGTEILGAVAVINNGIVQLPATPPLPLSAGLGGIEAERPTAVVPVTAAQLEVIAKAALARMASEGLSRERLVRLEQIRVTLADVQDGYLSEYADGRIAIDSAAAGRGWFVDPTPMDDDEFPVRSKTERRADPAGQPAGRYDLLTSLMHEMHHVLGRTDLPTEPDADDVMAATLPFGRSPHASENTVRKVERTAARKEVWWPNRSNRRSASRDHLRRRRPRQLRAARLARPHAHSRRQRPHARRTRR